MSRGPISVIQGGAVPNPFHRRAGLAGLAAALAASAAPAQLPPSSRPIQYGGAPLRAGGPAGQEAAPQRDAAPPPSFPRPGRITQPVVAGADGVRALGEAPRRAPAPPPPDFSVAPAAGAAKPNEPIAVTPASGTAPGAVLTFPPAAPTISQEPAGSTSISTPPAPPPAPLSASLFNSAAPAPAANFPAAGRQAPNVSVERVAPEAVSVGVPMVYELVVRNQGATPVVGVRVEEEAPTGGTVLGTDPAAEAAPNGRMGWSLGTLEAGAERRVKIQFRPAEEGELRGRATVSFGTQVEGRVRVTRPRVTVAVSAPESARVGEKVPLRVTVGNAGSGPASKVTLNAKFSGGLSHPAGAVIEAALKDLPAGQTKTFNLDVVAATAGAQECVIVAAAEGAPPERASAALSVVEPMLVLKQTGPAKVMVRGEPTYSIDLGNPGSAATEPITVTTVLPDGLEFASASDGGAPAGHRTVVWRLAALPARQTRGLTLKLKAAAPCDGAVRTVAQALPEGVAAAGASDAKPLEARDETAVRAEGVPALRFEVADLDDPVMAGQEAVYEIKVRNGGTGRSTNVQLVAEVSEGATPAGATPAAARAVGQQVIFDPLPELPVGGEATFRVRVRTGQPGDARLRVRLACDQMRSPVTKEESTQVFKE